MDPLAWAVTACLWGSQSKTLWVQRLTTKCFFDGIDSQLILELGARTRTKSSRNEGVLGFGARYQRAIGKHHILRLGSFVAGEEGVGISYGLRTEWMIKF